MHSPLSTGKTWSFLLLFLLLLSSFTCEWFSFAPLGTRGVPTVGPLVLAASPPERGFAIPTPSSVSSSFPAVDRKEKPTKQKKEKKRHPRENDVDGVGVGAVDKDGNARTHRPHKKDQKETKKRSNRWEDPATQVMRDAVARIFTLASEKEEEAPCTCVNGGVLPSPTPPTSLPSSFFLHGASAWIPTFRKEEWKKTAHDASDRPHDEETVQAQWPSFFSPPTDPSDQCAEQPCICPLSYTGQNCSQRQCPHSIGGEGPYAIRPVNDTTQFCDACDTASFTGMHCQMCQTDEACAMYLDTEDGEDGGRGGHCHRGMRIQGNEKQYQCALDSPYFIQLMGDGRNISADVLLNWSTTDKKVFGKEANGLVHMTIYRKEPENRYIDPFFRCDASLCTYRIVEEGEDEEEEDEAASILLRSNSLRSLYRHFRSRGTNAATRPTKKSDGDGYESGQPRKRRKGVRAPKRRRSTVSLPRRWRWWSSVKRRWGKPFLFWTTTTTSHNTTKGGGPVPPAAHRHLRRRWGHEASNGTSHTFLATTSLLHGPPPPRTDSVSAFSELPWQTATHEKEAKGEEGERWTRPYLDENFSLFSGTHLDRESATENRVRNGVAMKEKRQEADDDDDDEDEDDDEDSQNNDQKKSSRSSLQRIGRVVGQVILLLFTLSLTLLGSPLASSIVGPKRRRKWTIRLSFVLAMLTVCYVMVLTLTIQPAHVSKKIRFECQKTRCACAEDPPAAFTPLCSQSPVLRDVVLPSIQNGFHVLCDLNDGDGVKGTHRNGKDADGSIPFGGASHCQLMLEDLNLVFHTYCNASECVRNSQFPPHSDDTDAKESEEDDGPDGGSRHVPQRMTILRCLVYIVLCTGVIIALHAVVLFWQSQRRRREFRSLFIHGAPAVRAAPLRPEKERDANDKGGSEERESDATTPRSPHDQPQQQLAPSSAVEVHFGLAIPSDPTDPTQGLEEAIIQKKEKKKERKKNGNRRAESHSRSRDRLAYLHDGEEGEEAAAEEVEEGGEHAPLLPSRYRQKIEEAHQRSSAAMCLEVQDLSYTLPTSRFREEAEGKQILHRIHFAAQSGDVVAIMGPSGAGKSSLLDIISARTKAGRVSGELRVNGTPIMVAATPDKEERTRSEEEMTTTKKKKKRERQRASGNRNENEKPPKKRTAEEEEEEEVVVQRHQDERQADPLEDSVCVGDGAEGTPVPPSSPSFFSRCRLFSSGGCFPFCRPAEKHTLLLRQQYRSLIGYVSQQDTLLPALTVRQTIYYAARLKLPSVFSSRVLHRIIEEMIDTLKLTQCADTMIGDEGGKMMRGISGGERRRVSIAVEMLSNPRILLLDEPTSGLDSVSAQTVMEAIVKVAKRSPMRRYAPYYFAFQPIVMFSIHQPSSDIYALFDQVILLSQGLTVYTGPAAVAPTVLAHRFDKACQTILLSEERNTEGKKKKKKRHGEKQAEEEEDGVARMKVSRKGPPSLPIKTVHAISSATAAAVDVQRRIAPYLHSQNPAEHLLQVENQMTPFIRHFLSEQFRPSPRGSPEDVSSTTPGHTRESVVIATRTTTEDEEDNGQRCVGEAEEGPLKEARVPWDIPGDELLAYSSDLRRFYAHVYQQLEILVLRSADGLLGSYSLIACHAGVVVCLSLLLFGLYEGQSLDLPGALNRAGCITFLLLVTSFMSISGLEALLVERQLFLEERENGFYASFPYFMSKLVVDILPFRVLPSMVLGSIIYFPMGFRVDQGWNFFYFIAILVLYSVDITLMTLCIGILTSSFGSAALLSSVMILLNFVFGGAMVQADTLSSCLRFVQRLSPFFLAFETLMVNELDGQACTFSPTDETGKPSGSIPIQCRQYLTNEGLRPYRWSGDIIQLCLYSVFFVIMAVLLISYWTKLVR